MIATTTRLLALSAAVALLSGCAAFQSPEERAAARHEASFDNCDERAYRDAGLGVKVERCTSWTFGPSRAQNAAFVNSSRRLFSN